MTTTPASRTLAWLRQFAKLWGFALFCVLVVYIFREVVLPFLFAILVAYILAPLVARAGNAAHRRAAVPALGGGHHPLRLHPQRRWGCSSATSSPSCRATSPGCSGRRPQLFAKVNKDWLPRAGAWIDTHFAPEEVDPDDDAHAAARGAAGAARDPGRAAARMGAIASTSTRSTSRCRPLENGKYLIAPPAPGDRRRRAAAGSGSVRSSSGSRPG